MVPAHWAGAARKKRPRFLQGPDAFSEERATDRQVRQNTLASPNPWTTALFAALVVSALMAVLFRFGIVSVSVATFFLAALTEFPLTADVTAWYGTGSIVVLVALVGIAGYGLRTASAGKPPLGAVAD